MGNAQVNIRKFIMITTIFMWIVHIFNVCFWIVWPSYNAYVAHKLFSDPNIKIEFFAHHDLLQRARLSINNSNQPIEYIACRLWADADHYYEWHMTEDGAMLRHHPRSNKTWWERERISWYHSPAGDKLFKFKISNSYSVWGPLGWIIRKQVREHFVMAKLGGFKTFQWQDETRQKI
jgi:hypothetical protein